MKRYWMLVLAMAGCLSLPALALDAHDALRLKHDLTPVGAERAGNKDGSIPAWTDDRMTPAEHLAWMKKIADESPIYTVTHANLDKYKSLLSAGELALFARYPDFAMPVYPTHRTAKQPQWTYDNTYRNVTDAKLSADGNEVLQAWPGIPFPIPQNPYEVMWNHQLRWKGVFIRLHLFETTVFSSMQRSTLETMIETYAAFYDPSRDSPALTDWRSAYYFSHILNPAKLAGGGLLIHESLQPLTHPTQSWVYLPGERRMRRSPAFGYDSPVFNSEGLRVADEIDVFNGALDRYNWKLLGKREMLIPYNNQKMRYNPCDDPSALGVGHLKPYTMRFEKHRVWVVDAVLKLGERHLYPHRTFYIDEDTWSIAAVDIYDRNGTLWRTTLRFAAYYEAMPGVFSSMDVYHDLEQGAYFMQCSAGVGTEFFQKPPPSGYFSPVHVRDRLVR